MKKKLFKTNPEHVTPFGIWLAVRLNKIVDKIWPFVHEKDYDRLLTQFNGLNLRYELLSKDYLDFENYHFDSTDYPQLNISDYHQMYGEATDVCTGYRHFQYKLEPARADYKVNPLKFLDLRNPTALTDNIKEVIIKGMGKRWQEKGEAETRRFLDERMNNDNRKIY